MSLRRLLYGVCGRAAGCGCILPLAVRVAFLSALLAANRPAACAEPVFQLRHAGSVRALDFSPDGKLLATVSQGDREIRLWDAATGKAASTIPGPPGGADFVAFSAGQKLIAFGGSDNFVYLWDCSAGKELRRLAGHEKAVSCVAFSADGSRLAAGGDDATIRVWDVPSGKEVGQFKEPDKVNAVSFSPDGRLLASAGWSFPVHLWDVATGKVLRACAGHRAPVIALGFSPDGGVLATGSQDGTARLWEVRSGKEIEEIDRHTSQVNGVTFAPDGRHFATAGGDGTLDLWQVVGVREVGLFRHASAVNAVAFSPDGRRLASAGLDGFARVWNVEKLPPTPPPKAVKPGKHQPERDWTLLAHSNPRTAYRAVWRLSEAASESLPVLREQLLPLAANETPQRLAELLRDLNGESASSRNRATKELIRLGELAEPPLRAALAVKPASLQARRRVERVLEQINAAKVDGSSPDVLRAVRCVRVLEWIGSAEARQILEKLAQGMPDAQLTRDAQAALKRLAKRPAAH